MTRVPNGVRAAAAYHQFDYTIVPGNMQVVFHKKGVAGNGRCGYSRCLWGQRKMLRRILREIGIAAFEN